VSTCASASPPSLPLRHERTNESTMETVNPQHLETDSVVDLQLPIDDSLELGTAADILASEGDSQEDYDDFEPLENPQHPDSATATPLRAKDSVVAVAGTASVELRGLLSDISNQILPSWIGWPSRGTLRGGGRRPAEPRSLPPVQRVAERDGDRAESAMAGYVVGQDNMELHMRELRRVVTQYEPVGRYAKGP